MEGGADIVLAADTANHIVEFVEPSPRPEANQSTTRNDVLSSRENADGSVDIVIGRGQLDNATVFHIPQSERERVVLRVIRRSELRRVCPTFSTSQILREIIMRDL
jgi:hypothetical protein